jgi:hypothetical protein
MTTLYEGARLVDSRLALAEFARSLCEEVRDNPGQYENADLVAYLGARAAWIEDMDGCYANLHEETPAQPRSSIFAGTRARL